MEKVLVSGATGFVGANLVRRLLKENFNVHILIRESSDIWRLRDIIHEVNDHKVDLRDFKTLTKTISEIQPDYIIHLAIYGGRLGQKDETEILESNLVGTINLINASTNINYKCFINTGSSSEYGIKTKAMLESDICEPTHMYGITKASATMYCNYRASFDNKNIGTLRLFSPFGEFEDKGRLVPDLIIGAINNKRVLLANPESVRDYIFIEDVCDIYLKILKEPEKLKGQIFNIGLGKQRSVEYMANIVKDKISEDVILEYNSLPGRISDTEVWLSDNNKIKNVYNWNLKYTVEKGLEKTIEWFKDNIELYNKKEIK